MLRCLALAAVMASFVSGLPARAQSVLAICNDPKGRGFVTSPSSGWTFERFKDAVLIFSRDKAGRPEIMIRDTRESVNLAREGARLTLTHAARDYSYFIITAVYQQAQVDTFQLTFLPNGKGRLVWNSMRTHLPPKDETKGTFLVAECSR